MLKVVGYCGACGDVIYEDDFAINVHSKLFCSFECEATYESRDVGLTIEANPDADPEGG